MLSVAEIAEAFQVTPMSVAAMLKTCGFGTESVGYEALAKIEPLLVSKAEQPTTGTWSTKAESNFWRGINQQGKQMPGVQGRCWDWVGSMASNHGWGGGGTVGLDVKADGHAFCHANRFSWQLFNGLFEDPSAVEVSSKCGNEDCSNPDHLFLKTARGQGMTLVEHSRHGAQAVAPIVRKKAA